MRDVNPIRSRPYDNCIVCFRNLNEMKRKTKNLYEGLARYKKSFDIRHHDHNVVISALFNLKLHRTKMSMRRIFITNVVRFPRCVGEVPLIERGIVLFFHRKLPIRFPLARR